MQYGEMDFDKLYRLGFSSEEVELLRIAVFNNLATSDSALSNIAGHYVNGDMVRYARKLASGQVEVRTKEELIRHAKKMNRTGRKLSISDLALSKVKEVPRMAMIAGIPEKSPFAIYNSSNYDNPYKGMYRVKTVGRQTITIVSKYKPVIKYGEQREIAHVIKLLEFGKEYAILRVSKDFCRMCNRFVVTASFKMPEYHCGMIEYVAFDGTPIYLYADMLEGTKSVSYNTGRQRVYGYGCFKGEIPKKIADSAVSVERAIKPIYREKLMPTEDFFTIQKWNSDADEGISDEEDML